MLKVKELHAGYGRIPILNGVTLDVTGGQVLGILGHNGMGKTTLIKTLMGFIDTTQGTIQLEGQDITRASPNKRARAGFGYVPQGRDIFPRMTVRDNLRFAVAASGSTSKTKVDEILDQGIIVRDVARGLVDFPSLRDDRDIYLCWIDGEEQVKYWHEIDQGFSQRQPI